MAPFTKYKKRSWLRHGLYILFGLLALPYVVTMVYALVPPPMTAMMVWKTFEGNSIDYRWRPLADTSQNLVRSVVTAEDAKFCEHAGVDWEVFRTVARQALENEGGPSRGGSTITQQVAKNLFLWPSRSYVRKALELPLAMWIDLVWSKRRIVEIYINTAEWGPGIYGAEAAAQYHFGKSGKALTKAQAAQLAATLPNPTVRNAGKPGPKVRRQARTIRKRVNSTVPYLDCLKLG
ncbi:MAG: monofunctional biosynthetic peptidoglycan transglycosylase [Anderseniella sp.]